MTFLEPDHLERDPYRKFVVGLAHAFGGALLVLSGFPLWLVIVGYIAKELAFDLSRIFVHKQTSFLVRMAQERLLVADSIVDWGFWSFGALMVSYDDPAWGWAVLAVGSAYFVAMRWQK